MAKVLVVDDEASIRILISEILTRYGHTVITAADAEEAIYRAMSELPDVALVDLVMPGTGGMSLIMDTFHRLPAMSLIAMSGRIPMGNDAFSSFSEQFGVSCFLGKPFTVEELSASIDRALLGICPQA